MENTIITVLIKLLSLWVETLDAKYLGSSLELLVWPHEVEPWFHSWYRGRVETLDAKYTLTPLYVATPAVQREIS